MSITEFTDQVFRSSKKWLSFANRKPSIAPAIVCETAAVIEVFLVVVAAILTKFLYLDLALNSAEPTLPFFGGALIVSAITYAVFRKAGLHELASFSNRFLDAKRVGLMLALVFLLCVSVLFVLKISATFSRGWICLWFAASYSLLLGFRAILSVYIRLAEAEGRLLQRVAIYGSGQSSMRVANALADLDPKLIIAGIFDDPEPDQRTEAHPISGGLADLIACGRAGQCDRIVVVLRSHSQERIRTVLSEARDLAHRRAAI